MAKYRVWTNTRFFSGDFVLKNVLQVDLLTLGTLISHVSRQTEGVIWGARATDDVTSVTGTSATFLRAIGSIPAIFALCGQNRNLL